MVAKPTVRLVGYDGVLLQAVSRFTGGRRRPPTKCIARLTTERVARVTKMDLSSSEKSASIDPRLVTADGSPLAIYLALPADDGPSLINGVLSERSTILELGSGPGRMTRVLTGYGHRVTAVDDNPAMLAHVTGAQTIRADLYELDLDQRFDGVVAASHLINSADEIEQHRLLDVCVKHLDEAGVVFLERYPPGWLINALESTRQIGPVAVTYEPGALRGRIREARVTYRLGMRRWSQDFAARDVSDDDLTRLAREHDLAVARYLDDTATWAILVRSTQLEARTTGATIG